MHKFFQFLNVFITVKCDAFPFSPISAGASGFLVIALQAFGYIVMNDEPHIGFVNAHSKSDGGHNHIHIFHQEFILVSRTGSSIHPCMVWQRFNPVHLKCFCYLFHFLPAQTINDARFPFVLFNKPDDLVFGFHFWFDLVIEVGPVKRSFKYPRIENAQVFLNIVLHLGGSCSG